MSILKRHQSGRRSIHSTILQEVASLTLMLKVQNLGTRGRAIHNDTPALTCDFALRVCVLLLRSN